MAASVAHSSHQHNPHSFATSWNPNKSHSERERWICIYPAYLNSKKSVSSGRKIPLEKCVENPTCHEIKDVLANAGFSLGIENKMYPRERDRDVTFRGRVRVQLKNDDGEPLKSNFPTRKSVLFYLGDTIPKLKSRQQKHGSEQHGGGSQGGGGGGGGKGRKGKGKGKR